MDDLTIPPATPNPLPQPVKSLVPLRFQGRWPLVAVLALEALLLGGTVALSRGYGPDVAGHALVVMLVPAVILTGLGLFLTAWRASIRRRSFLGWILLLGHLGTFVAGATVLAAGLQMKREQFPVFVLNEFELVQQAMISPAPADSSLPALAATPSGPEAQGEERGEAVAIEVPEEELSRGDSLVAKGVQDWDVVVRRDTASEAVVRILVSGERRVALDFPDSGRAWSSSGEVVLLQCHHRPVAAVTQLGLCPRLGTAASAEQELACEEPVVPHMLLVNLRTGKRRLLGSEVGSDAALDSAQQWFKGEHCAI